MSATGTPPLRLGRHVARHLVRNTRRTLRDRRHPDPVPIAAGRARLVPATAAHAMPWFRLVAVHGRPPAEGLLASPLGGAARSRAQWRARLGELRAVGVPAYLVVEDGELAGEVLVYVDRGTAAAELVVWLTWDEIAADVLAALADTYLGGDVRRVQLTAAVGSGPAKAAGRAGFDYEGTLADPPFGERQVFVRHVDGGSW